MYTGYTADVVDGWHAVCHPWAAAYQVISMCHSADEMSDSHAV